MSLTDSEFKDCCFKLINADFHKFAEHLKEEYQRDAFLGKEDLYHDNRVRYEHLCQLQTLLENLTVKDTY